VRRRCKAGCAPDPLDGHHRSGDACQTPGDGLKSARVAADKVGHVPRSTFLALRLTELEPHAGGLPGHGWGGVNDRYFRSDQPLDRRAQECVMGAAQDQRIHARFQHGTQVGSQQRLRPRVANQAGLHLLHQAGTDLGVDAGALGKALCPWKVAWVAMTPIC